MAKLIKSWEELVGLESENYMLDIDVEMCNGWVRPKVNTDETTHNWAEHNFYLSTHTFYGHMHQESTRVLQKFGFDIEIDNWDKDNPKYNIGVCGCGHGWDTEILNKIYNNTSNMNSIKEPKLTTNQRKIKEFKEKANRPNASDNDVKKLIRACGGDVDKAVALILEREIN